MTKPSPSLIAVRLQRHEQVRAVYAKFAVHEGRLFAAGDSRP